jgi:uncharacterized protein (DUF1501 family)
MQRRRFLAALPAISLLASPLARAANIDAAGRNKLLLLVYLKGGNDAYNTYAPLNDPAYRKHRPTLAMPREQLIPFSPTHGFHPAMAPLLSSWESKDMALLQGIGQQEITNQHYRDLEMQFTASGPDQYLTEGWVTRAFTSAATPAAAGALDALAFGDLDIREADPMGPFRGDKLRVINMQHPTEWLGRHRVDGTQHLETSRARALAASFSQTQVPVLQTAFPADEFGQALCATVQLAAAGLAPPVMHITINAASGDQHDAFDTHWNQLKFHGNALARLASGLAAFREGMIDIGQWQQTLVATYDEFGRSPAENESAGTHHGWASTHLVMGGRVRGGLLGEPLRSIDVFSISGPPPVIDYRALYTTIIEQWWGGSARDVFARRFDSLNLLRA